MLEKAIAGLLAIASVYGTAYGADTGSRKAELDRRYLAAVSAVQQGDFSAAKQGFAAVITAGPTGNAHYNEAMNWLEKGLYAKQQKTQLQTVRGNLDAAEVYASAADSTKDKRRQQELRREAMDLAKAAKDSKEELDAATANQKVIVERKQAEKP